MTSKNNEEAEIIIEKLYSEIDHILINSGTNPIVFYDDEYEPFELIEEIGSGYDGIIYKTNKNTVIKCNSVHTAKTAFLKNYEGSIITYTKKIKKFVNEYRIGKKINGGNGLFYKCYNFYLKLYKNNPFELDIYIEFEFIDHTLLRNYNINPNEIQVFIDDVFKAAQFLMSIHIKWGDVHESNVFVKKEHLLFIDYGRYKETTDEVSMIYKLTANIIRVLEIILSRFFNNSVVTEILIPTAIFENIVAQSGIYMYKSLTKDITSDILKKYNKNFFSVYHLYVINKTTFYINQLI